MEAASQLKLSLLGRMALRVSVLVVDFFWTHTVFAMVALPLIYNFAATTGHWNCPPA
jgi:hypothetical protein